MRAFVALLVLLAIVMAPSMSTAAPNFSVDNVHCGGTGTSHFSSAMLLNCTGGFSLIGDKISLISRNQASDLIIPPPRDFVHPSLPDWVIPAPNDPVMGSAIIFGITANGTLSIGGGNYTAIQTGGALQANSGPGIVIGNGFVSIQSPVPEPGILASLITGLLLLAVSLRRRNEA